MNEKKIIRDVIINKRLRSPILTNRKNVVEIILPRLENTNVVIAITATIKEVLSSDTRILFTKELSNSSVENVRIKLSIDPP